MAAQNYADKFSEWDATREKLTEQLKAARVEEVRKLDAIDRALDELGVAPPTYGMKPRALGPKPEMGSLSVIVKAAVAAHPGFTLDELVPYCNGLTRKQVAGVLYNNVTNAFSSRTPLDSKGGSINNLRQFYLRGK